jgi:hypothetical protein
MTASQSLSLFQIVRRFIADEAEASTFVSEIESVVDNKFEHKKEMLATKTDIKELELKIAELKTDTIKWMFVFWTGSIVTILGGLFGFLKLFLG